MRLDWRTELPCWVVLIGMFAMASVHWPHAPEALPVHWDMEMRPDRYGGRFEALLGMPLVALGLYLALSLFPRFDPGRPNYPSFAAAYFTVRLGLMALMAGIYVLMLRSFRTGKPDMAAALPILGGAFLIVIGSVLPKLGPNWLIGIRTPWTLSSRLSWKKTHRIGSWVLIACGALIMASPLAGRSWALVAALVIFGVAMMGVAIYSYFPWRDDPDKVPPGGHARAGG